MWRLATHSLRTHERCLAGWRVATRSLRTNERGCARPWRIALMAAVERQHAQTALSPRRPGRAIVASAIPGALGCNLFTYAPIAFIIYWQWVYFLFTDGILSKPLSISMPWLGSVLTDELVTEFSITTFFGLRTQWMSYIGLIKSCDERCFLDWKSSSFLIENEWIYFEREHIIYFAWLLIT